ncbi:MAG TPA: alpha/beta hydrolase [Solirubrobacteraceae bacterium]|nr:alpha/beta hydrolase [Solirubrobacteraceae bacterium]
MRRARGAKRAAPAALLAFTLLALAAPAAAAAPRTIEVGGQRLRLCQSAPVAYCGRLRVPLDRAIKDGPKIPIAYRWYPASGAARHPGTLVPVEGGPGYGSIGSAEEFATMYGPLLRRWNMLVIDNRGTGTSATIDCPSLQDFSGPTAGQPFALAAAECAASLNGKWHAPGGAPIHASDLFTSAAAAQDMAEIIRALHTGPVDLYGDSYGSFFAQVFADRYPRLLRTVVLDSTYSIYGLEPWYRSSRDAMPADFDRACERWSPCASAEAGEPWQRIGELAARLRAAPISGEVPGTRGAPVHVTMGVVGLVDLVNDAAGDLRIYAELDAAARAALAGYDAPLLRLYEQRLIFDEDYFGVPPQFYSVGLYLAVGCLDYPQLFEMSATGEQRALQFQAAQEALPAGTFSPFTTEEWLAQDENTEAYSACLDWPSPTIAAPPVVGTPPLLPASLPVLVLGGELDTWTPPGDHPKILAYLGGDARFIEVANATHVVGEGDTPCGSRLVREFVQKPRSIQTMNAGCVAEPPVHAVGVYPRSVAEEQPAGATRGHPSKADLRLLAAAVATAADAVERAEALALNEFATVRRDRGLNGGEVALAPSGALTLRRDEFVPGLPVSGHVALRPAADERDGQIATATLRFAAGTAKAVWSTAGAGALARITAVVDGRHIGAREPAP